MLSKNLVVTMPDQSRWSIPVEVIARNRATSYAADYGGDVERSLQEDTRPLFAADDFAVEDWAANNMDWSDAVAHAKMIEAPECDYQEGWMNGDKVVE